MREKKSIRTTLLQTLLQALVNEWGYTVVHKHLNSFAPLTREELKTHQIGKENHKRKQKSQLTEKPSASALAAKVSLPPNHKKLIEQLAARYESKDFLPTSGDIRYFFEVHGEVPPPTKQRSESFRKVLRLLCALPEDALRQIIENNAYSGPSRLAPLSEAIRGVGERRLSNQDASSSSSDIPSQYPDSGIKR